MTSDHINSTNDPDLSQGEDSEPRLPPARHRTRPVPPPAPEPAAPEEDTDSAPYTVGYGKPPTHSQFKPGQSGNPRGRPKAAKALKTIVRETMTAKVSVRTAAGERTMTRMEAVMLKTLDLATKGNARAQAQIFALYGAAVPDETSPASMTQSAEELSAADIAMLEALQQSLAGRANPAPLPDGSPVTARSTPDIEAQSGHGDPGESCCPAVDGQALPDGDADWAEAGSYDDPSDGTDVEPPCEPFGGDWDRTL